MMNRQYIDENTIQFEDYICSGQPYVGQFLELPMNAFGSVMARFQVTEVTIDKMVYAIAKKVSQ